MASFREPTAAEAFGRNAATHLWMGHVTATRGEGVPDSLDAQSVRANHPLLENQRIATGRPFGIPFELLGTRADYGASRIRIFSHDNVAI